MKYTQVSSGSSYPYPDNNIDPAEKQSKPDFCLQYAKAAYSDWSFAYPKGVFANNGGDYERFRMYALGKQPNSQYKRILGVDQQTNNTWLSIDWSVRPIVSPYRDMAIARMMEQESAVVAVPIDMLAKSDLEQFYAQMKAKLAVRNLVQNVNQDLANHPMISLQSGEPMDVEELEMRIELGEHFNRSKDAEQAVELGFYENNYKQFRKTLYEDLFDYGVCGYREWLGDDNKAKFRKVNPECVITNFCRRGDFESDCENPEMIHAGEIIDVALIELATKVDANGDKLFTDQELNEFATNIAGKWGNPATIGSGTGWFRPYDKFKCKVLDICFYSYDEYTYTDRTDKNGNPVYRQEEFKRGKKNNPRYDRKCFRTVYKCKWIIGTEHCYDWGLLEDQKLPQDQKKKSYARLPFRFYAYNFYEMKAQGYMERLVPYLDDYQLTIYKIQNFKNRAVPSGWWIDLDALENVALNKGGKNMTPRELLQMFFDTGALVGRSKDLAGNPMGPNWKPVIPISNTAAAELSMFYQDIINTIAAIEKITGFNEVTTGQADPKMLVPGIESAQVSTTHALYPMKFAEEYITEHLAEDVLLRMQQGVKKGEITGFAPYRGALNANTLSFMKISPAIAMREYGIMLQEKTTDEQKMWVLQQLSQDIANGMLDTSDAILILNTHNVKQAMQILAYKVGKAKQAAHQNQMQLVQQQGQQNAQVAQQTAAANQQQLQTQMQFELMKEKMALAADIQKKQMELASMERMKQMEMGVKYQMNAETADAKVSTAEALNEGKVIATHIAGDKSIEKQEVANQKPAAKK